MRLSLNIIALMCNGDLSNGSNPELIIEDVVIDSRKVANKSLFIAIKGETQDGHSYVAEALKDKQAVAIVQRDCAIDLPNLIYVEDTVQALGLLSHNYRMQFDIPVVAITGSNGKTTVKEMLRSICNLQFGESHVLATSGNLNNHLGVPLTLLSLSAQHKVAIIEMGMNHSGELEYLSMLARPTTAVVNNVMLAHAGFFNSLADIAKAKGEVYTGLVEDGIACVNLRSPFAAMWQDRIADSAAKLVNYAKPGSSCYIYESGNAGELLIHTADGGEVHTKLQVLGEHNKANALTATALALSLGCNLDNIAKGLANYTGYKGRLEQKRAFNGALIVDDSYNANPDSVKAAILAIKDLPSPHWFIFADLKELGKFSESSHQDIAAFAVLHGIDCLLTVGELARITYENFNGEKLHFNSNQDIVEYCMQHLPKNATLLVKGSNSMGLNTVVTQLTHLK